ncbi:MAG TPA: hypothetical protein VHZ26_03130 [Caulobacteraceae bacterium]|jgi:hypothetical protein|nr:hypothetical protein [Caulobacteraceae bacterium]
MAAAMLLPAGGAWAFDSGDPVSVLSVLTSNGASGEVKVDSKGNPWIDAKAGKLGFEVDFLHCESAKTRCGTVIYAMGFDMTTITLEQLNGWNRWAELCPAYLTSENHPRTWFGVKPSPHDGPQEVKLELNAWLDCMSDFDKFTDNPEAFLKSP